jgi:hypothetical protein
MNYLRISAHATAKTDKFRLEGTKAVDTAASSSNDLPLPVNPNLGTIIIKVRRYIGHKEEWSDPSERALKREKATVNQGLVSSEKKSSMTFMSHTVVEKKKTRVKEETGPQLRRVALTGPLIKTADLISGEMKISYRAVSWAITAGFLEPADAQPTDDIEQTQAYAEPSAKRRKITDEEERFSQEMQNLERTAPIKDFFRVLAAQSDPPRALEDFDGVMAHLQNIKNVNTVQDMLAVTAEQWMLSHLPSGMPPAAVRVLSTRIHEGLAKIRAKPVTVDLLDD